jgi:hypothetical protein
MAIGPPTHPTPRSAAVGIDNATRTFTSARHPKSFVSLAGADHLLGPVSSPPAAAGSSASMRCGPINNRQLAPVSMELIHWIVRLAKFFSIFQNLFLDSSENRYY